MSNVDNIIHRIIDNYKPKNIIHRMVDNYKPKQTEYEDKKKKELLGFLNAVKNLFLIFFLLVNLFLSVPTDIHQTDISKVRYSVK